MRGGLAKSPVVVEGVITICGREDARSRAQGPPTAGPLARLRASSWGSAGLDDRMDLARTEALTVRCQADRSRG